MPIKHYIADESLRSSGGIYRIRNLVNGKCYYGSAKHFGYRWRTHIAALSAGRSRCHALQRAWKKYGYSAFVFEPLFVCSELMRYEQMWLDHYRPFCGVGYNIRPIADVGCRGVPKSQEHRNKIAASLRGKKMTPGHHQKMMEGRASVGLIKGQIRLPDETRARMSDSGRRRWSFLGKSERQKLTAAMIAVNPNHQKKQRRLVT